MSNILPNQVYAGLFEILKDEKLYRYSRVSNDYCHLTEEGEKAVIAWMNLMGPRMHTVEKAMLDARAKQLVFDELKK